jgi:hypothetical protein
MNIIIVCIAALAACAILWLALSKKKDTQKVATYECPHCGELHCDCYLKDEAKPPSDPL